MLTIVAESGCLRDVRKRARRGDGRPARHRGGTLLLQVLLLLFSVLSGCSSPAYVQRDVGAPFPQSYRYAYPQAFPDHGFDYRGHSGYYSHRGFFGY